MFAVLMNGTAQIVSGFVSFGTLHIHTPGFEPWQWLMIITGIITLAVSVTYFFLFPDSPTSAWFLTTDERRGAVARLRVNQTGVENKRFKRAQVIEALCDPKTWLFALFSALDNIPNSLTNQRQLIVASFGYSQLQVTLLGCVDGSIEIVTIATGVWLASRWPNARAWVGIVYFLPNILGAILVNVLPWHNKIGLLFSVWLTGMSMIFSSCEVIAHGPHRRGNNRLRAQPFVAERSHRGAHQESDHERDHALRVLHRQRRRPVHVAGQVQAAQSRPVGDHWRLLRRVPTAATRHPRTSCS
jgi:hypothetical protein